MPAIKVETMPDPWETIERMEGTFLLYNYQIVRLGNGAWRGTANKRGTVLAIPHIVKESPGETLCALTEAILAKT